jgi:hypothetical protein
MFEVKKAQQKLVFLLKYEGTEKQLTKKSTSMKYLTLLLLLSHFSTFSQETGNTATKETNFPGIAGLYLGIGLSYPFDFQKAIHLHGTLVTSKEWGSSFQYGYRAKRAVNLPSNYYAGLLVEGLYGRSDFFHTYSLLAVREYPVFSHFSLGLEGGPAIIRYRKASYTVNPEYDELESSHFNKSHSYIYNDHINYGLKIKAKAKASVNVIGVEIAPTLLLSARKPDFSVDLNLNIGYLSDHKLNKDKSNSTDNAKNAIIIEAGGIGFFYSAGYERQIKATATGNLNYRAGVGILPFDSEMLFSFTQELNKLYKIRQSNSFLEVGSGMSYVFIFNNDIIVVPRLGYRYQRPGRSGIFRIAYTPLLFLSDMDFHSFPGISYGKSF